MGRLNDLISEVHGCGAKLVVSGERVGVMGKIPDDLKASVKENKKALIPLLQWNEEEAFSIIRQAASHVAKKMVKRDLLRIEKHAKRSKAEQLVRDHLHAPSGALTATQIAIREDLAKEEGHWAMSLLKPELPDEVTPQEFVVDELRVGSGVRFKEMVGRWEEAGGDAATLRRAIESGKCPGRLGKEPEDFYQLYVYPVTAKAPESFPGFSREEETIEETYANKDMGDLRMALRAWVNARTGKATQKKAEAA